MSQSEHDNTQTLKNFDQWPSTTKMRKHQPNPKKHSTIDVYHKNERTPTKS